MDISAVEESLENDLTPDKDPNYNFNNKKSNLSQNIPLYAIKGNVQKRHNIIKRLPFSREMISIFDYLCEYCISPDVDSPIIEINEFKQYCLEKKNMNNVENKKIDFLILDVIKLLADDEVQVIKVLEYGNDNNPSKIQLLEEYKKNLKQFKQIKNFVYDNFKAIKNSKAKFFKIEEMSKLLNLNIPTLESFSFSITLNEVNLENLEAHFQNKEDKIFFIFNIEKENCGKIVLPILSSLELTYSLINIIKNFYKDEKNQEFKNFLFNKLEENKLESHRVHSVLSSMRIQDPYFLFFSQVFQTIVKNIYRKKNTYNNKLSLELNNQLVAAIILSQISFNHRERIRKKEEKEEKKQIIFKNIFKKILNHSQTINGVKVFFPVKYEFIETINLSEFNSNREKKPLLYYQVYKKKDFLEFISSKNSSKEIFKEFLIFQVKNEIFYLHRTRLITCFLTFTQSEKREIFLKLKNAFKNEYKQLFSLEAIKNLKLMVEKAVSPIYSTIYHLILKLFNQSEINITSFKKQDLNYLLNQLFFNDLEILNYKNDFPDLCIEDFQKKKNLFLIFLQTVFDQFGNPKNISDLIDIDFYELKQAVLNETEINFFLIIYLQLKEFIYAFLVLFKKDSNNNHPSKKNIFKRLTSKVKIWNKKDLEKKSIPTKVVEKEKLIIENIPELKNYNEFKKKLLNYLWEWNRSNDEEENKRNLEQINLIVNKALNIFSIEEITEKNKDFIYEKISENNPFLKKIANQTAVKNYFFYKLIDLIYQEQQRLTPNPLQ